MIVSRSFYPKNSPRSFRATELAKEFSRIGCSVTVLTPTNPSVQSYFKNQYQINIKNLELPLPLLQEKPSEKSSFYLKLIRRIKEQFLYYPEALLQKVVFKLLSQEHGYDLLISVASPHSIHWGVSHALKKNQNITRCWVADCGDPFMKAENLQYKRPFYFQFKEKNFCRSAHFITVPFKGAIQGYFPEFQKKIHVIPQGFNFEDFPRNSVTEIKPYPVFAYAGSLNPKRRNPVRLIEFLLRHFKDFEFHVYSGNTRLIEPYAADYPEKIICHGLKDRPDLLRSLSSMNFVINFENQGTTQMPSKLIDYAILKKPVLSIHCNEFNEGMIKEFMNGNYSQSLEINDIDQYRIENVAQKFLSLIHL